MAILVWDGSAGDGDWSNGANWSTGSAPASGDDVYLRNATDNIDTGLNQSAVALDSLTQEESFTGTVGTETAFLQIGSAIVTLGLNPTRSAPAGSGRINIDLGSTTAAEVLVLNTKSQPADSNRPPVRLLATNASTNVTGLRGHVGIADEPDDTATVGVVTANGRVDMGPGVTWTTATANRAGDILVQSAGTTLEALGGAVRTLAAGAITTVLVDAGGLALLESSGTVTTLNLFNGLADLAGSQTARTLSTVNQRDGGTLRYDPSVVTISTLNIDIAGLVERSLRRG